MTSELPSVLASFSFHGGLSSPLVSLILKKKKKVRADPSFSLNSVEISVIYFLPWIPALSCTSFREQTYICFISSPLGTFAGSQWLHCLCWDLFSQSRLGFPWFSPLRCRDAGSRLLLAPFSVINSAGLKNLTFFWNSQTLPLLNINFSPKDCFSLFSPYERTLLVCPESHPNRPEQSQPGMKVLQPGSFFSNT